MTINFNGIANNSDSRLAIEKIVGECQQFLPDNSHLKLNLVQDSHRLNTFCATLTALFSGRTLVGRAHSNNIVEAVRTAKQKIVQQFETLRSRQKAQKRRSQRGLLAYSN